MQYKHHDIDKLFQDAFQEHEVASPFNMWNKIESNLPLAETDRMFKKALENYETEPSSEVWERIKPELPLSLLLRNSFVQLSRIAAILLFGITLYIFVQRFDWQTNQIAKVIQKEQGNITPTNSYYEITTEQKVIKKFSVTSENINNKNILHQESAEVSAMSAPQNFINATKDGKIALTKVTSNRIDAKKRTISTDKSLKANNKGHIPNNKLFFEATEIPPVDSTKEKAKALQNMKMKAAVASTTNLNDKIRRSYKKQKRTTTAALPYLSLRGEADESFQTKDIHLKRSNLEKAAFDFTGLQFSINAAFGTSAILNTSLKESIAGSDGQYKLLSNGHNFGLGLAYQFKPNWSIETGTNYTNSSQSYTNFAETAEKVNFNYLSIPLTFKYRSNEITGAKPAAISYIFGLQTAFLQQQSVVNFSPTTTPNLQELAIQQEVAATVGIDYDLFLNPNVSWTIGARATVGTGVKNVFEHYNTFIGIRSGFNFRVKK